MPVLVIGSYADTDFCVRQVMKALYRYYWDQEGPCTGTRRRSVISFTLEQVRQDTGNELHAEQIDATLAILVCCQLIQFESETEAWVDSPGRKTLDKMYSINRDQATRLKRLIC